MIFFFKKWKKGEIPAKKKRERGAGILVCGRSRVTYIQRRRGGVGVL